MEYLTQWEFWQEVGLAVAARLAVVAVALWAVKMTMDQINARSAQPKAAPQPAAPAAGAAPAWPGLPPNERIKAYYPLEGRHRPLTLKKPGAERTPWQEKMEKYLAGQPALSAGLSRRPR